MAQSSKLAILGISGSGRKRSFNTALLEAAKQLLPQNATLEVVDVSRLPLYNQDLEHEMPVDVKELKKKIRDADAILIATPRTQLFHHSDSQERDRMGQQAAERRLVERQTRCYHQRLNVAARRSQSSTPPSTDHDRPKHVPDQ